MMGAVFPPMFGEKFKSPEESQNLGPENLETLIRGILEDPQIEG